MTTPPTDQQLDEIETRHTAATKGPWRRSEDYSDIVAPDGSQLASYWMGADGEFIAHAPDDVRALLDEVRRQRAELAAFEMFAPQQCPAGKHADWLVDSEYAHACPWCQIEGLRAQLADQADADTVADRAAKAITAMGADLRAMTGERNRYRNAWHNACTRAVDARSDANLADAASEATSAPLRPSQPSGVSEVAQSPTGASEGALRAAQAPGIPQPVEDLADDDGAELRRLRATLTAAAALHEKGEHNGLAICLHCATQLFPPPDTGIWSESAYPCATLRALGVTDDWGNAPRPAPSAASTTGSDR